jgi:cyanophycin synthetase
MISFPFELKQINHSNRLHMIRVGEVQFLYWWNRISEHPVAVCKIDLNVDQDFLVRNFPLSTRELLQQYFFSSEPLRDNMNSKHLLLWLVRSISRYWDVVTPDAGVIKNKRSGSHELFSAFGDENIAGNVIKCSVDLTNFLTELTWDDETAIHKEIRRQHEILDNSCLGPATRAVVRGALDQGISWMRHYPFGPFVQLGHGKNRKIMVASVPPNEGQLAVALATDKAASLLLMSQIGLPVGKPIVANNAIDALNAAQLIGFPVALKPRNLGQGVGVWAKLSNEKDLQQIASKFEADRIDMIIQSHFYGDDHRLLVIEGRFVAAAQRIPASVCGDGILSIRELIAETNSKPDRGIGHSRLLNHIVVDNLVRDILREKGMTIETVPIAGQWVQLRLTANISTGGTAVDVTDVIHPDNIRLAERAAHQLELKVAGVDFITTDISKSWKELNCGICEVNATVGLRPHWNANRQRNIVKPLLAVSFPDNERGDIPIAMITGTNGKTTTTLILMNILRAGGHVPGAAVTDGVIIDEEWQTKQDVAGVPGARRVLGDPDVTAAALETARGGILKRGLAVRHCDAAALLNIRREQIGMDGIDNIEDMLELKRVVTDCAQKAVVLNVDDALVGTLVTEYPAKRVIVFSLAEQNSQFDDAIVRGSCGIKRRKSKNGDFLVFTKGETHKEICRINDIPLTMNGFHRGNIANAMAAAGLAYGMGISIDKITAGLKSCEATRPGEPGRMIWLEGYSFDVLVDYAINASSFETVVEALKHMEFRGKRICLFTGAGNRPDWAFDEISREVASAFDHFICYERPDFVRKREPGEISMLLASGLILAGVEKYRIHAVAEPEKAMEIAKELVDPDDFLAIFGGSSTYLLDLFRNQFGKPDKDPIQGTNV